MPNSRKIIIFRIANFLVFRVLWSNSKRERDENCSIGSPFCSLSNRIWTIYLRSMVTKLWIENWNRPKMHLFHQRLYLWGLGLRQETLWHRDLWDFSFFFGCSIDLVFEEKNLRIDRCQWSEKRSVLSWIVERLQNAGPAEFRILYSNPHIRRNR